MRAGADVGAPASDFRVSVGGEHDAHRDGHLPRVPHARRHAPADELAALAHGARLAAAPLPAEGLRALLVTLAQLLAAVGLAGVLVTVRIAAQAQLQRIELERDRKLVHRAFERKRAGRRARAAHIAGGREVELGELVYVFRVGAFVEEAGPAGLLPVKILVLRGHRNSVVGDGLERAGGRGAELDALE